MSRDYISIGATPLDEPCQQLGPSYDRDLAFAECRAFARQLKRLWPLGRFSVKGFDHDFGRYYEVVACWDDDARAELAEFARGRREGTGV